MYLRFVAATLLMAMLSAACGGSSDSPDANSDSTANDPAPGIRGVSALDGAAIHADPPDDLVVLDVRTAEEFDEGRLEGAVMIDFYRDDFGEQIAQLDPDVPYLLYCRSGSRSGQAAMLMQDLGFNDVAHLDGGILAWYEADLPTVTD